MLFITSISGIVWITILRGFSVTYNVRNLLVCLHSTSLCLSPCMSPANLSCGTSYFLQKASLGFDYDALWGCSVAITNTFLSFPQLFHEVGFTVDQRLGGKQKFQLGELPS